MKTYKRITNIVVYFLLLLSSTISYAAVTVSYYHNDILGSPVAVTNAAGQVVWTEDYQSFGETIKNEPASATNQIGYTGKQHDKTTGLTYFGARYYDPVIGRFMGMDPAGVSEDNLFSFNRYAYANNNPYKFVDPDGRAAIYAQLELKGQLGSYISRIMSDNSYNPLNATGGKLAVGIAVSFPFFGDGAEFDLGAVGSADAIGVNMDERSSFTSLPGLSGGGVFGVASGSVVDLRGESISLNIQTNIGKKLSKTAIDAVSYLIPEGKVKNYVETRARKAAGSLFGFVGSISAKFDENQDIKGFEFGIAKGFNFGVNADVGASGVCSFRSC